MTHTPICDEVAIKQNDVKGRYMITRKAFTKGAIIFAEAPISIMMLDKQPRCHNATCLKQKPKGVNWCLGCRVVEYCSKECQKQHWGTTHRKECKMFQATRARYPSYVEILQKFPHAIGIIRLELAAKDETFRQTIAYKQYLGLRTQIHESPTHKLDAIAEVILCTLDNHPDAPKRQIQTLLGSYLSRAARVAHYRRALSLWLTNAFDVYDTLRLDVEDFAIGLYPHMAMIEHSCVPNCIPMFNGTTMGIVCTRDMCAGEAISIDYISDQGSQTEKRALLLQQYHFVCTCVLCTVENID